MSTTKNRNEGAEEFDQACNPAVMLDATWLRELARDCGADDAGFVEVERSALVSESWAVSALLPGAKSIVSVVVRVNRDAIGSPWMGVANREAGFANKTVDDTVSAMSRTLARAGVRSVPLHAAFPMDTAKWPGKIWPVALKIIAQEAGMGVMGHHRLVIHPEYGSSIVLGGLVVDREISEYGAPLDKNPCDGCKLCVAACPTGAIGSDGAFNFINCSTHNYRYRLGGFVDWTESLTKSRNHLKYRSEVSDAETVSMWQALAYGTNYTCLNCLAVCPKGERNAGISHNGSDPGARGELVRRLRERVAPVYVIRGSDAERHAEKIFPSDKIRRVRSGTRPNSAGGFLGSLPLVFQPGRAKTLNAVFHFIFTGADACEGTVEIRNGRLTVEKGLKGEANLTIRARGDAWVAFLRGERRLLPALLTGSIRVRGPFRLLMAFAKCFPG